jgi:hypothetical protein
MNDWSGNNDTRDLDLNLVWKQGFQSAKAELLTDYKYYAHEFIK